jgi:hypothetical protein
MRINVAIAWILNVPQRYSAEGLVLKLCYNWGKIVEPLGGSSSEMKLGNGV